MGSDHKHDCGHDHSHGHGLHHHHHHVDASDPASLGRIRLAFWLNLSFAVLEIFGGIWTNSMAIVSDAVHDLGDSAALGLAYFFEKKSFQKGDHSFSYGYRRFSAASALITGLILMVGSLLVIKESLERFLNPTMPHLNGMILFAFFGVAVNGYAAFKVSQGTSLNERVITWHLMEDLVGWVLVLIGAIIMKFVSWPQIDSVMALMLSAWILWNVMKTFREGARVFLQAVPRGLKIEDIRQLILSQEGVEDSHHMHLWSLDGEKHILTTHLVVQSHVNQEQFSEIKTKIKKALQEKFQIAEATLEIEWVQDKCSDPEHL